MKKKEKTKKGKEKKRENRGKRVVCRAPGTGQGGEKKEKKKGSEREKIKFSVRIDGNASV